MSVYGIYSSTPLVISTDVDDAIIAIMQTWMSTYCRLLGEERECTVPAPKSYSAYINVDEIMDHQLPALVVTTAKTSKVVGGSNTAQVQATWATTVSAIARGRNAVESKQNAALLEGALRRCFLNKCRGTNSPLNDPRWMGVEVAPLAAATRKGRYLAAALSKYNVATNAAVSAFGGPDVPDADSYVPNAPVTVIPTITVEAESE